MSEPSFFRATEHYDQSYFDERSKSGEVGAALNRFLFEDYVRPWNCVIDFGCGAGFMLRALRVSRPIGIEINPVAHPVARANGVDVHSSLADVEDGIADVVISCHALEHVENPLEEMRKMYCKLKPGGHLVLVVPCDRVGFAFSPTDPDFHLFSWSASNLGNLARCANFDIVDVREVKHRWPPNWEAIHKRFGFGTLQVACHLFGLLPNPRRQVKLVASKPERS